MVGWSFDPQRADVPRLGSGQVVLVMGAVPACTWIVMYFMGLYERWDSPSRGIVYPPCIKAIMHLVDIVFRISHSGRALPVYALVAPEPVYVWLERRNLDLCSTLRGCSRRADCEETTFRYIMNIGPAQMRGACERKPDRAGSTRPATSETTHPS